MNENCKYPNLFSVMTIRGHEYRNRIITGPTMFAEFIFNPECSENIYRMVEKRAAGGAAEVVTGELTLDDNNAKTLFKVKVDIDELDGPVIEGFTEYARRIHKHGAVALLELCHSGGDTVTFSEERMEKICSVLKRGAIFARKAGFDGILIHGGHGFLIQQFVSPLTNKRCDEYGGSIENRSRFPKRILKAIREGLGEDGILEMRFSAEDGVSGGMTIEDTKDFLKEIDGMVDIIHLSNGIKNRGYRTHTFTGAYNEHGYNIKYAAEIKKVVTKSKVAVIGGINDPAMCEEAIKSGKTDFVIISRQAIADPEFANKAKENREEYIRKCIRCFNCYPGGNETDPNEMFPLYGEPPKKIQGGGPPPFAERPFWEEDNPLEHMLATIDHGGFNIGECTINPEANLRVYPELFPDVTTPKNILIVGGGPAGMQALITAVGRGHNVTLIEATDRLGGLLKILEKDKRKRDLYEFKKLLEKECFESSAKIIFNCRNAKDYIENGSFDNVIIAIGGHSRIPDISGVNKAIDVVEACSKPELVKGKVAIIGGGFSCCEASVMLAEEGHEVTVISRKDVIAPRVTGLARTALLDEMEKYGVVVKNNTIVQEIKDDGVFVINLDEGIDELKADTIVYAIGTEKNYDEAEEIAELCQKKKIKCTYIGDCVTSGKVVQATREGYIAAMMVH